MVPKYSAEWWEKVAARPLQKLEASEPGSDRSYREKRECRPRIYARRAETACSRN